MDPLDTTREIRESARELKFAVDPATAGRIRERARELLSPDPYAGGANGDEYQTSTLYFDTAEYSVYRRKGSFRRAKHRIRRYGAGDLVFLERKLRTADLLSKRRTIVRRDDLPLLTAATPDPNWEGRWFHERVRLRRLAIVCQVTYRRTARVGMTDYGPIRLTVDEDLRGLAVTRPEFEDAGAGPALAADAIVELKFRAAMPAVFKRLVEEFHLQPQKTSKYRLAIEAVRPDVVAAIAARKAARLARRAARA
jgi:hypothetical protein